LSRIIETIEKWWKAESSRHFLWLPVAFGAGIGAYYGLPIEPPPYVLPLLAGLMLVAAIALWRRARMLLLALLLMSVGAAWANLITLQQSGVILAEALSPRPVLGEVENIERTEHGVRFTLSHLHVSDLAAERTPAQARLSIRLKKDSDLALPQIGDTVHLMAGLMPPMGPALPNGFDFARFFYDRDIGSIGYGMPPWEIVATNPSHGFINQFRNWRLNLTESIIHTLGTGAGGVAAGLITGDARAITKDDFEALRASNLYHIIAISGEHMVVIAGVIFITLRLLALLLPKRMALRPHNKSIAAGITLVLMTLYLFVTGTPISAVRAYVMIVLVLGAILFRRQVDAMRSLAIAAFAMLVMAPADLLDPGFQLSFAATLAIIAFVEVRLRAPMVDAHMGRFTRGLHVVLTMLLISVVAEIATAPIVISHFNNLSLYGVFANMLATPIMSLFLMPTVALFFILLPLGLSHFALMLMKWGVDLLLSLARWVESFPHAQQFVPSIPGYGLVMFVVGLLWLCVWQTRVRRYGAIAMALGVMSVFLNHSPDILVGSSLKQIAIHTDDGYRLARGRATSMVPELWANGLGYEQFEEADAPQWRCDKLGCIAQVKNKRIAFPFDSLALAEDCRRADVIITAITGAHCDSAAIIVDTASLNHAHVLAVWLDDQKTRIETSNDWQGNRPWSDSFRDDSDE